MPYRRLATKRAPKKPVLRRLVATAGRAIKKRYVGRKGLKVGRIAKDVMMLKRLVNVEKKRAISTYSGTVGQVNGAGGGAAIFDITPALTQGDTAGSRNGNVVKVVSMYMQGQFIQQSATLDGCRISIEIWCHKAREVPMSLSSTGAEIYVPSPFSGQIDLVSRRNQDYFSDYVCLRKVAVWVPNDTYGASNQFKNKTFNIGVKLQRHLRWSDAGTLINGQMFLIMRCQHGNASASTASTANVAHQGVNTGWKYDLQNTVYFVDN